MPLSDDEVTGQTSYSKREDKQSIKHMTGFELEKQLRERLTAKLKSERQEIHSTPVLPHDASKERSNSYLDDKKGSDTRCSIVKWDNTQKHVDKNDDTGSHEHKSRKHEKRKKAKKHKQNKHRDASENRKCDKEDRYESESVSRGQRESKRVKTEKHDKRSDSKGKKHKRKRHKSDKDYGSEMRKNCTKKTKICDIAEGKYEESSSNRERNVIKNEDNRGESVSNAPDQVKSSFEHERMRSEKQKTEFNSLDNTPDDTSYSEVGNTQGTINQKSDRLSTVPNTGNAQEPECHRRVVFKLKSQKKNINPDDKQSFSQVPSDKLSTVSREVNKETDEIKNTGDQQVTASFENLKGNNANVSGHMDVIMNVPGNGEKFACTSNKLDGEVITRNSPDIVIKSHTSLLKRKVTEDSTEDEKIEEKRRHTDKYCDSGGDIKSEISKGSLINNIEENNRGKGTEVGNPDKKTFTCMESNRAIISRRVNDSNIPEVSSSKSMDKEAIRQERHAPKKIGMDVCSPEIPRFGISNKVDCQCDTENSGTRDITLIIINHDKEAASASTELKINKLTTEHDAHGKDKRPHVNVVRKVHIIKNDHNQQIKMTTPEGHVKRSRWDKINTEECDRHELGGSAGGGGRMKEGREKDDDNKQNEMGCQSTTKCIVNKSIDEIKGDKNEQRGKLSDDAEFCNEENGRKCRLTHVEKCANDISKKDLKSVKVNDQRGNCFLNEQSDTHKEKSEISEIISPDTERKNSCTEISMKAREREIENKKVVDKEANRTNSDKFRLKKHPKEELKETYHKKDQKKRHLTNVKKHGSDDVKCLPKENSTEKASKTDKEEKTVEIAERINQLLIERKRKRRDDGVEQKLNKTDSKNKSIQGLKEEKCELNEKVDLSTTRQKRKDDIMLDAQSIESNSIKRDKDGHSNSDLNVINDKHIENVISEVSFEGKYWYVYSENVPSRMGSGIGNHEENKNDDNLFIGKSAVVTNITELSKKCIEINEPRSKKEVNKIEDSYSIKRKSKEQVKYTDDLKPSILGENLRDDSKKVLENNKTEKQRNTHMIGQNLSGSGKTGDNSTTENTSRRSEKKTSRREIKTGSENDGSSSKRNSDTMKHEPLNGISLYTNQCQIKQLASLEKETNEELSNKASASQIIAEQNIISTSKNAQMKHQTKKRSKNDKGEDTKPQNHCKNANISKQSENEESCSNINSSLVLSDERKSVDEIFSDNASVKRPHDAATQAIIDDLEAYVLESTAPQPGDGQENDSEKPSRGLKSRFNISITASSLQRITGKKGVDSSLNVTNYNCGFPATGKVIGGFPKLAGVGRKVEPAWVEPDDTIPPADSNESIENTEKPLDELKDSSIKNEPSKGEESRKVEKEGSRKKHRSKVRDSARSHKRTRTRRKRSSSRGRSHNRRNHRRRRRRSRSSISSSSSTSLSPSSTRRHREADRRHRSKSHGGDRVKRKRRESPKPKSSVDQRRPAEVRLGIDRKKLRRIAILNMLRTIRPGLTNVASLSTEDLKRFQAGGVAVDELEEICKELSAKQERLRAKGAADHIIEAAVLTDEEEVEACRAKAKLENADRAGRDRSDKSKTRDRLAFNISESVKVVPLTTPPEPVIKREQLLEMFPVSSGIRHQVGDDGEDTNHQQPSKLNPTISNDTPQSSSAQCTEADTNLGEFTGKVELVPLSQKELQAGIQPWLKKSQFFSAAPVTNSIGQELLKRMGWREGEGLGKNKDGPRQPVLVDIKVDRKGLSSSGETMSKKSQAMVSASQVSKHSITPAEFPVIGVSEPGGGCASKHPVSVLLEHSNKRRWNAPLYKVVHESGPSHSKNFLMSVTINGQVYMPSAPSRSKREAKLAAANSAVNRLSLE